MSFSKKVATLMQLAVSNSISARRKLAAAGVAALVAAGAIAPQSAHAVYTPIDWTDQFETLATDSQATIIASLVLVGLFIGYRLFISIGRKIAKA